MTINPKIKQKADDIRYKMYGEEVRESLASGLEGMSEDVEFIKGRQNTVESTFQSVVEETTGKDVISAPELITARNGKSNLKTRLDEEYAQVTTQLAQTAQQVEDIAVNIEQYPRIASETDDSARFNRAIGYLTSIGGGTLQLKSEEYVFSTTLIIPNNIRIKGQGNKQPWITSNVSLLSFNGTGEFIKVTSYYNQKVGLSGLNIRCVDGLGKNSKTTGIRIVGGNNEWGGSATINKITITGFGVGIQHSRTWNSVVRETVVRECGTGISYDAFIEGAIPTFGNVNLVENTTIYN